MPLTLQQLQTLNTWVQAGLGYDERERRAWFDALVINDDEVRVLLERALFLERGVSTEAAVFRAADDASVILRRDELRRDTTIGAYTLVEPLGEGGSANVWRARRSDGTLKRDVALKLPYFVGNTRGWHERVLRERDILASLQHPNIATIYDAGIEANGRPWLALELIEGATIDRHCKEMSLDAKQRIALIVRVARAVEYAHARGVIHRDLKPGNILIDQNGQPKLLDFGIAKLLDPNDGTLQSGDPTMLTRLHGRPLTPEYASPEQQRGDAVTTGVDVYALAIVLHELIADARPGRSETGETCVDLRTAQTGPDLEAIIKKALHRDVNKRYGTMSAFADDLERYLKSEPVLAQPDSRWYRFARFVLRNRVAVAATTAVATSLVVGTSVAMWQASEANLQRRAAELENKKATAVKEFLVQLFEVNREDQSAAAEKRKQPIETVLGDAALALQGSLSDQPLVRAELMRTLGGVLFGLSMTQQAEKLRHAQLDTLVAASAPRSEIERARIEVALTEIDRGDWDAGRAKLQIARETLTPPAERAERVQLADALSILGQLQAYSYNAREAIKLLDESIRHAEMVDDGSGKLYFEQLIARASAYSDLGDIEAVNRDIRRGIEITERLHGRLSLKAAAGYYREYEAQFTLNELDSARRAAQTALEITRDMQLEDSFWGARANMALGRTLVALGQPTQALAALSPAISTIDRVSKELEVDGQIATRTYAADAAFWRGERKASERYLSEAVRLFQKYSDRVGGSVSQISIARSSILQLTAIGNPKQVELTAREALQLLEKSGGTSPDIGLFTAHLADALATQGKESEARSVLDQFYQRATSLQVPLWIEQHLRAANMRLRTAEASAGARTMWTNEDESALKTMLNDVRQQTRPLVLADTLLATAEFARKTNSFKQAEVGLIKANSLYAKHDAGKSANSALALAELSLTYTALGKSALANETAKFALASATFSEETRRLVEHRLNAKK